jgi:hypothetical protein
MRNLRLLPFILLIFISGNEVYCQKIFRDGYVVKKGGESIYGLVEYSSSQDIPSKCTFKRFDIAREVGYTPESILAFGYKNGNRYESRELNNKKSFYEVLVTGRIVLYRKGSGFYVDKDHLGLVELKSGPVNYPSDNDGKKFGDLADFLNYLTEGKPGNISKTFSLKNEIVPLITSFNKNSGKDFYVYNRTISTKQLSQKALETGAEKSRFGFVMGTEIYMMKLTPEKGYTNYLPDPEKESAMVFGITYERLLSRKSDRYSLKIDLLYNRQTFYCYEQDISSATLINRYDAFFNFTGIKAPVLFQYSLTGGRIIPFINAGFAYQYHIEKDYLRTKETENITLHEVKTFEDRDFVVRSGEVSGVAGIGLRTRLFNNLSLHMQGRIEYGPGILELNRTSQLNEENPFKENSIQATFLLGITF